MEVQHIIKPLSILVMKILAFSQLIDMNGTQYYKSNTIQLLKKKGLTVTMYFHARVQSFT